MGGTGGLASCSRLRGDGGYGDYGDYGDYGNYGNYGGTTPMKSKSRHPVFHG